MEIRQIRYFVAIASIGNFTKAAKRCHVSQPALSSAIHQLEIECDQALIERSHPKAILTASGKAFLIRATRILDEVENASRELHEMQTFLRKTIRVGVPPTIAPYFLPRVTRSFMQNFPDTDLLVVEETTADLLKLLEEESMDLAIVTLPITAGQFEVEKLFTEELLLALPSGHPLARKQRIQGNDLQNQSFILFKDGHCLADQTQIFLNEHAVRPRIALRTHQIETVRELVSAGLGIALVPAMVRLHEEGGVVYRSLESPHPTRTIAVIWRKRHAHTPAATEFLSQLRKTAKEW
jgi:LysR family transcriptional regulator, hydrogen peroxide-inducible genes activator